MVPVSSLMGGTLWEDTIAGSSKEPYDGSNCEAVSQEFVIRTGGGEEKALDVGSGEGGVLRSPHKFYWKFLSVVMF